MREDVSAKVWNQSLASDFACVSTLYIYMYIRSRHRMRLRRSPELEIPPVLGPDPSSQVEGSTVDLLPTSGLCKRWAVVAPINSKWASEAVRRQVRMYDWCLVIVFDKTPSKTYDARWFGGEGNEQVVILTPEYSAVGHSEFVKSCSWDHIGRKNIGYYYAIVHGANTIWDFDMTTTCLKFGYLVQPLLVLP